MHDKAPVNSESLCYFLGSALALYAAVHYGIPLLYEQYDVRPLVGWWLASGVLVFALFVAALLAARARVNAKSLRQVLSALNIRSLSKADILWAFGGLLVVVLLTAIVVTAIDGIFSINLLSQNSYASILRVEKLKPDEHWLFLVWIPYFFFNIVGRGASLERISLATTSQRPRSLCMGSQRLPVGNLPRWDRVAYCYSAAADRIRCALCRSKAEEHLDWNHHSRALQWERICHGRTRCCFLGNHSMAAANDRITPVATSLGVV